MKKSNKKLTKIFGFHLALDLYDCDPQIVRNIEECYRFLALVPEKVETHIQSPPFVIYKKGVGFAGWIPVVESGISLYVYFPTNFATIDIYTCKKFDPKIMKHFVIEFFKPKRIREYYFLRGKKYTPPIELLKVRGLI
jgi:S-adenosylmethionine/arginine decarboxylase-like enzyme